MTQWHNNNSRSNLSTTAGHHALPHRPPPPQSTIGMKPDQDPNSKHGIFQLTSATKEAGTDVKKKGPLYMPNPACTLIMEHGTVLTAWVQAPVLPRSRRERMRLKKRISLSKVRLRTRKIVVLLKNERKRGWNGNWNWNSDIPRCGSSILPVRQLVPPSQTTPQPPSASTTPASAAIHHDAASQYPVPTCRGVRTCVYIIVLTSKPLFF